MSLIDAPLAVLDRILARRSPSVQPDDPVARIVTRTTGRLHPERHYQRRLRGRLVNQYVAMREGLVSPPARRREMGRLGRAVLYSSFALAVSASAVGAASMSSLPGDPLYAVKRQVEELRIQIAPPSVRPSLVAAALDERLTEIERLAADQRWSDIPAASADAAAAEQRLVAIAGALPVGEQASLAHHTAVLTALLARAPLAAQAGLRHAIEVSSADHGQAGADAGAAGGGTANGQGQGNGKGNGPAATANPVPTPEPTPDATKSPHPDPSAKPSSPTRTPAPHATSSPVPSDAAQQ